MKRMSIAVLLLVAFAFSTGCTEKQAGASDKARSQQPSSPPESAPASQAAAQTNAPRGDANQQPLSQQTSYKPSHLTFRGLHAGQSQEEVWAVVRANGDADFLNIANDPKTNCKRNKTDHRILCEGGHSSLVFSREGKLIKFQVSIFSHGDNPDEFFAALNRELAAANHEEGTEGTPILGGRWQHRTFTWGTDQTVACPDDRENACPTEQIRVVENRSSMADLSFADNAYLGEDEVTSCSGVGGHVSSDGICICGDREDAVKCVSAEKYQTYTGHLPKLSTE
jgi:hypothetical protein